MTPPTSQKELFPLTQVGFYPFDPFQRVPAPLKISFPNQAEALKLSITFQPGVTSPPSPKRAFPSHPGWNFTPFIPSRKSLHHLKISFPNPPVIPSPVSSPGNLLQFHSAHPRPKTNQGNNSLDSLGAFSQPNELCPVNYQFYFIIRQVIPLILISLGSTVPVNPREEFNRD